MRIAPLILVVLLLGVAGCRDEFHPMTPVGPDFVPTAAQTLQDTLWRLVSFETEGKVVVPVEQGIEITLRIDSTMTVTGFSGCNTYRALAQIAGDTSISFLQPAVTGLDWCDAGRDEIEKEYLDALDNAHTFRVRSVGLKIYYGDRGASLNFIADRRTGGGGGSEKRWSTVGALRVGRAGPTATLLPNRKILVVGGYNGWFGNVGAFADTSCELYDPNTRSWTPVMSNFGLPRLGHTATLLQNEEVLVVGGTADGNPAIETAHAAEIFDPVLQSWRPAPATIMGRSYHTATLLPKDGRVLVAGGGDLYTVTSGCEIYDPDAGWWYPVTDMNFARMAHSAVLLPDDRRVFVVGGSVIGDLSAEIYDPVADRWSYISPPPLDVPGDSIRLSSAVLLEGVGAQGSVLVVAQGDSNGWIYDVATGRWNATPPMTGGGVNMPTLTALCNGSVLLTGFAGGHCEIYDPTTGRWSAAASMKYERTFHAAVLTRDCGVLVIGGIDLSGSTIHTTCELLEQ